MGVAAALALVQTASAEAAPVTVSGSLTNTDSTQNARINRGGRVSGCGTAKPAPTNAAIAGGHFDQHTFTNTTGTTKCITVEPDLSGCGANPSAQGIVSAHLGSYNPANPSANYLGDPGLSGSAVNPSIPFSFKVDAGGTYVVVVSEVTAGNLCAAYSLDIHEAPVASFREAAGPDPASIQAGVDQFRADLGGGSSPGPNGAFGGLRREINWDEITDDQAAPANLAGDFFNTTSPRGAVFTTPGTGFQVSADSSNPTATPAEFGNINAGLPAVLQPFSSERLFTMLGSNQMDAAFRQPGTADAAFSRGFGAVFSDPLTPAIRSFIRLRDGVGDELGIYVAPPPAGNGQLTFIGASFPTRTVASVTINTEAQSTGGVPATIATPPPDNAAALDDFVYGEPGVQGTVPLATAPMITQTNPASPANDTDPELIGTVGQAGATEVRIFKNASCSGVPDATGSVAVFTAAGITVNVADGSTTQLSALSADGGGEKSACSGPVSYIELPPDTDNDGVPDATDQCPTEVGQPPSGCPVVTPTDQDGDGNPDSTDICPIVPGAAANGCPDVARKLTIKYEDAKEAFKGKLRPKGGCSAELKIKIVRKEPGPDQGIGKATTTSNGKLELAGAADPGAYYAKTKAATVPSAGNCLATKSRTATVQ